MLYRLLVMMLVCNVALATYEIYRSNCRRYGVFKVHTRNKKLTTGLIVSTYAEFLALCARTCLRTFNCKAINYKPAISNNEPNCEILSSGSDTAETLLEVVGWNFYKPLTQNVIPACMTSDNSAPCNPGYTCEESCSPSWPRFNCVEINECASNPCYRGSCNDQVNNYYCSCPAGWRGKQCNTDIDECASNPCVYGSCNNHENSYSCSCNFGWGGPRCDKLFGIGRRK